MVIQLQKIISYSWSNELKTVRAKLSTEAKKIFILALFTD
jgi:hypothetical protein